jgi:hypothetical protein
MERCSSGLTSDDQAQQPLAQSDDLRMPFLGDERPTFPRPHEKALLIVVISMVKIPTVGSLLGPNVYLHEAKMIEDLSAHMADLDLFHAVIILEDHRIHGICGRGVHAMIFQQMQLYGRVDADGAQKPNHHRKHEQAESEYPAAVQGILLLSPDRRSGWAVLLGTIYMLALERW